MATLQDYEGRTPAWCPGCGNFSIRRAFQEALLELGLEPHQFMVVSGIGQSGKFPHYIRCNTFNGLHGRSLPVATGVRLANHSLPVFVFCGDGDCYGEGGNHLLNAMRRNINVKLFVHDNQIYGLTKGQASPTSSEGTTSGTQPFGALSQPFNPMVLAVAMDSSFAARGFAGDLNHLKELMKESINHQGFSIVDILQPCVTFNKINTYDWYRKRCYPIEASHDPYDRLEAFKRALEFGERIPLGVLYKHQRPLFEEKVPVLREAPLVKQKSLFPRGEGMLEEFY
ncbi:MAG TPA: 2-oxoacid:ferredoxin oxidoreductase subunit beta [Syntrophorhabdales bacterium]|nr:2-oxoacid:ferredoxin oxidoreductase subunit beta [Syntrophorhabdales bacterium]